MTTYQEDLKITDNLYNEYLQQIDTILNEVIDRQNFLCPQLYQAIRYSLFSGGKRIRPLLVIGAAKCIGVTTEDIAIAACAIEFMHTYSLIHDDLPDMDNDEFRRGKKTCHIVYGSTTAILAGDALQCLAFEVITNESLYPNSKLNITERFELAKLLSTAAGTQGMVGGQSLDCATDANKFNLDDIKIIHNNKTGALMQASVAMGLVKNIGLNDSKIQFIKHKLFAFSQKFGALFQVCDDIKDANADKNNNRKKLSLTVKSNSNPSITSFLDPSEVYNYARNLQKQALEELDNLDLQTDFLRQLTIDLI